LPHSTFKKSYRPDIDGLRALAVISVVLFHMDSSLVPGGFIGVDIFFVISGFLITGIITRDSDRRNFSFKEFYRRRIKRIVPILSFVIVTTLVAAHFILLPEDLARLSNSAIASQFFFANIYFTYFLDVSYFADDASHEPLLHLWSLGVEEQFYLLWPLALIVLLNRLRRKSLAILVFLLSISSFLAGEILLSSRPMFAYYMLPTHAGGLLIGATCFFVVNAELSLLDRRSIREFLSWIGIAAVLFSLAWISENQGFPGINSVPVTFGTALLICAASRGPTLVSRILSTSPFVGIGLISYSMYLWHWPLLAFMKYLYIELTIQQKATSFIAIVLLSALSYRLVEIPFRQNKNGFLKVAVRQLLIPSMIILIISSAIIFSRGFGLYYFDDRYSRNLATGGEQLSRSNRINRKCLSWELTPELLESPKCIINGSREPRVLLWGDSHATHFVGVIEQLAYQFSFSFRSAAHNACPPLLHQPERFVSSDIKKTCKRSNAELKKKLNGFNTLIIAASWDYYFKNDEELFINELRKSVTHLMHEDKIVILLGAIPALRPFDSECGLKALKINSLNCVDRLRVDRVKTDYTNAKIRAVAESVGARYYDINDFLCDKNSCSGIFDAKIIYFDSGHLNSHGSFIMGQQAIKDARASLVFSGLNN